MVDIIISKEELEEFIRVLEIEFPELKQWARMKRLKESIGRAEHV